MSQVMILVMFNHILLLTYYTGAEQCDDISISTYMFT